MSGGIKEGDLYLEVLGKVKESMGNMRGCLVEAWMGSLFSMWCSPFFPPPWGGSDSPTSGGGDISLLGEGGQRPLALLGG